MLLIVLLIFVLIGFFPVCFFIMQSGLPFFVALIVYAVGIYWMCRAIGFIVLHLPRRPARLPR